MERVKNLQTITVGRSVRLFLTAEEWQALAALVQVLKPEEARKVARLCGKDCRKKELLIILEN